MSENPSVYWSLRYEQWLQYLQGVMKAVESGKDIALGPSPTAPVPEVLASPPSGNAPAKAVYCAPHPDDESLSGALALRLHLETGVAVTNVAVTLGSDTTKKARRLRELESACRALGFSLIVPNHPTGFDQVNLKARENDPKAWAAKAEALGRIFDQEKPDIVFTPHAEDFNTTHIGTHHLVVEALGTHLERSRRGPVLLVETEFWHQLAAPNLMVGITPETAAIQLIAATEHGGEMTRNPFHLLHPCRLMDNVRRGSEVVGGQGAAAQPFTFAELYRVRFMKGKKVIDALPGGRILAPTERATIDWLREHFELGAEK